MRAIHILGLPNSLHTSRMLCVGALISEADVDDNKLMEFSEFKKIMGEGFTPSRKGEL